MVEEKYEVIIVGGDHHNGLGLARIFGINKIVVHSIVISDNKKSFLEKSKYVNDCYVYLDERTAFDKIIERFGKGRDHMFVIPYSDAAALELDSRLNEFNGFMVPSINGQQGKISELMDKSKQYYFAKENSIRMAETITYYFAKDNDISNLVFPCIVKPVISAEGDKRDIVICDKREQLEMELAKLKEKHYERVLIQEYLKIDYEIDVFGCILSNEPFICQIPTKTIRSWPTKGGTNSYSQILTDKEIVLKCESIIKCLKKIGFYGLYDIELFVVGDEVILNEINFRNSGDVYMGISQGYYYPYAWTEDYVGHSIGITASPEKESFTMTECADIRNVLVKNIKFRQWIKEYRKCEDFALKLRGDIVPAIDRYIYYVKQIIKGKRL